MDGEMYDKRYERAERADQDKETLITLCKLTAHWNVMNLKEEFKGL